MRYRVILEQRVFRTIEIEPGNGADRAELCEVAAQAWQAESYEPDHRGDAAVLWIEEVDRQWTNLNTAPLPGR